MKWRLGLSSGMFLHSPILQALELIRDMGFRLVQISAFQSHFDYHDPDLVGQVRQELQGLGLRTTSLHAPYSDKIDLTLPREENRLEAVGEVKAATDALAALGGNSLILHAGSATEEARAHATQRLQQSLRSLKEIRQYCQARSITLAIEDMLAHLVGGRTGELEWLLSQLPDQGVGICLDTGHSFLAGSLLERVKLFGPRLVMVHAHDNRGSYDDHLPPGEGNIDWPRLLDSLADAGFRGEIVLEVREESDMMSLHRRTSESVRFLRRCAQGKSYEITLE